MINTIIISFLEGHEMFPNYLLLVCPTYLEFFAKSFKSGSCSHCPCRIYILYLLKVNQNRLLYVPLTYNLYIDPSPTHSQLLYIYISLYLYQPLYFFIVYND